MMWTWTYLSRRSPYFRGLQQPMRYPTCKLFPLSWMISVMFGCHVIIALPCDIHQLVIFPDLGLQQAQNSLHHCLRWPAHILKRVYPAGMSLGRRWMFHEVLNWMCEIATDSNSTWWWYGILCMRICMEYMHHIRLQWLMQAYIRCTCAVCTYLVWRNPMRQCTAIDLISSLNKSPAAVAKCLEMAVKRMQTR